jgi:hypothetical protein
MDQLEGFNLQLEVADILTHKGILDGGFCRATLRRGSSLLSQKLSRIGGFVNINGRPQGVTSAHGILASVWNLLDDMDNHETEIGTDEAEATNISDYPDDDYSCYTEFTMTPDELPEATLPTKWAEVNLGSVANFLGLRARPNFGVSQQKRTPMLVFGKDNLKSDFALVSTTGTQHSHDHDAGIKSPGIKSYRFLSSGAISQGKVEINLGGEMSLDGFLLEGPNMLEISGVVLNTLTIQLVKPLGRLTLWFCQWATLR